MTLLNTINVGGTDFGLLNNTAIGVCTTPAGSEVKACTFADSFELKAGVVVTIKFTYANTYGDGSTTYPKLSVGGTSYPIKYATNAYAGAGAWINGQTVPFMFDGTGFILVANLMQTSVISSANTTVNGAPLYNGANVKVMFTSALTGTDTSTALVLNYNGNNITVKVPVNGALADCVAKAVDESGTTAYYYCQAYTTFELLFDGTNFVITNNPVVYSNSDCEIKSDGSITYKNCVRSNTIYQYLEPQGAGTTSFDVSGFDWTVNEAFHLKISLIMNFFLYAEAEGSFGINNGTGRLMINYKSDKITSIIFDDTTKKITVQTNDNIWGAALVFGVPTNWVVCP